MAQEAAEDAAAASRQADGDASQAEDDVAASVENGEGLWNVDSHRPSF